MMFQDSFKILKRNLLETLRAVITKKMASKPTVKKAHASSALAVSFLYLFLSWSSVCSPLGTITSV